MFARQAVRKGDWKLVRMEEGVEELFNLAEDLGETNNLAAERPDKLRELTQAFNEWSAQMAEPLWTYPTPEEREAYRRSRRSRSGN
jgi:hypothetical protein